jgi:PBP1b-binding outer membrane lipoprotein LpoB
MKYLLVLLLSGCALVSPPKVVQVKIPVMVSCIQSMPTKPSFITDVELIKMIEGNFVTALHIDRMKRQSYEAELEAILTACQYIPDGVVQ